MKLVQFMKNLIVSSLLCGFGLTIIFFLITRFYKKCIGAGIVDSSTGHFRSGWIFWPANPGVGRSWCACSGGFWPHIQWLWDLHSATARVSDPTLHIGSVWWGSVLLPRSLTFPCGTHTQAAPETPVFTFSHPWYFWPTSQVLMTGDLMIWLVYKILGAIDSQNVLQMIKHVKYYRGELSDERSGVFGLSNF